MSAQQFMELLFGKRQVFAGFHKHLYQDVA